MTKPQKRQKKAGFSSNEKQFWKVTRVNLCSTLKSSRRVETKSQSRYFQVGKLLPRSTAIISLLLLWKHSSPFFHSRAGCNCSWMWISSQIRSRCQTWPEPCQPWQPWQELCQPWQHWQELFTIYFFCQRAFCFHRQPWRWNWEVPKERSWEVQGNVLEESRLALRGKVLDILGGEK